MKKIEVIQFKSDAELAHGVARAWLDELAEAAPGQTRCVALSGGRIAKSFYVALAQQASGRGVSLADVHFFWADERCVPAQDEESNFRIAQELLFTPLGIASENIHRMRGELSPADGAREASIELCSVVSSGTKGFPVFDLIFLGMGEDGHVASLFPGEPESVIAQPQVYRAVRAVKPPPDRVTLGYGVIAAAKNVWVLASGKGKEAALRESLSQGGTTPLARVIAMRPSTEIFTDIRAA